MLHLDVKTLYSLLQHGWFLSVPLFFMLLTVLKCAGHLSCRTPTVWVSLILPYHQIRVVPFEQEAWCHVSAVLKEG